MNGSLETCRLCGKAAILQQSHIIPAFVYRWHKRTQKSKFRSGTNPNVRAQDGIKSPMLCRDCEGMLSRWENHFAREAFIPIQEQEGQFYVDYRSWCLKFACSLSWRVAEYLPTTGGKEYTEHQKQSLLLAKETWKNFMFDKIKNPGVFGQHVLIFGLDSAAFPGRSEHLSRYIYGATDFDIITSKEQMFTYVKLYKFIFFGVIHDSHPAHWKGTRLKVNRGSFHSGHFTIPQNILDFINDRADITRKHLDDNMSTAQKQKIEENILSNHEDFRKTQMYQAGRHDIAHKKKW